MPLATKDDTGTHKALRRKLAAIVFADVAGYSRLMHEDEFGTIANLKRHLAELVEPTIAAHDGRLVKTTGDGILMEFPSAVAAVSCAIEILTRDDPSQRENLRRSAD